MTIQKRTRIVDGWRTFPKEPDHFAQVIHEGGTVGELQVRPVAGVWLWRVTIVPVEGPKRLVDVGEARTWQDGRKRAREAFTAWCEPRLVFSR